VDRDRAAGETASAPARDHRDAFLGAPADKGLDCPDGFRRDDGVGPAAKALHLGAVVVISPVHVIQPQGVLAEKLGQVAFERRHAASGGST
jgi:hypothetical protein